MTAHDDLAASIKESDAAFRKVMAEQGAVIYELVKALRPFANYACDEPHVNEPPCNNCIARTAIARAESGNITKG